MYQTVWFKEYITCQITSGLVLCNRGGTTQSLEAENRHSRISLFSCCHHADAVCITARFKWIIESRLSAAPCGHTVNRQCFWTKLIIMIIIKLIIISEKLRKIFNKHHFRHVLYIAHVMYTQVQLLHVVWLSLF